MTLVLAVHATLALSAVRPKVPTSCGFVKGGPAVPGGGMKGGGGCMGKRKAKGAEQYRKNQMIRDIKAEKILAFSSCYHGGI